MEDSKKNHPSLPANYVTIVDLQKRWMKQQQQQQQQETKREKEESNHSVLGNNYSDSNGVKPSFNGVKSSSQFQKFNRFKSDRNPNFAIRKPFHRKFYGEKPLKVFRVVEKVSNSRTMASEINVVSTNVDDKEMELIKREKEELNCEDVKMECPFQKIDRLKSDGNPNFKFGKNFNYGKNRLKEVPAVKKMNNVMPQTSGNNAAFTKVGIIDRVADEKKTKKIKKNKNKKMMKNRNGNGDMVVDVRAVEAGGKQWKGEMTADDPVAKAKDEIGKGELTADDPVAKAKDELGKGELTADDQVVVAKDKLGKGELTADDQVVEAKDHGKGELTDDQAVKAKDRRGKGKLSLNDQAVEAKDEQGKGNMTANDLAEVKEKLEDRQVTLNDQLADVEAKLKGVSVRGREWKNGRSMGVRSRRVDWGYGRVERRGFGGRFYEAKREIRTQGEGVNVNDQSSGSEKSMAAVNSGGREVNRWQYNSKNIGGVSVNDQFSGSETSMAAGNGGGRIVNRWRYNRDNGGGVNVNDHFSGSEISMAAVNRWGHNRGYRGGENWAMGRKRTEGGGHGGGLMWVKKCEVSEVTKVVS